jgi:hypothetical protein
MIYDMISRMIPHYAIWKSFSVFTRAPPFYPTTRYESSPYPPTLNTHFNIILQSLLNVLQKFGRSTICEMAGRETVEESLG